MKGMNERRLAGPPDVEPERLTPSHSLLSFGHIEHLVVSQRKQQPEDSSVEPV